MEKTILAYNDGSFIEMVRPDWYARALDLLEENLDWSSCVSRSICAEQISFPGYPTASNTIHVRLWSNGRFGSYVEILAGAEILAAVYVPEPRDWWTFHARYLAPIIDSTIALASNHSLDRIGNALISRGRYGKGQHINRLTGRSSIDAKLDEERRQIAAWRTQNRV